ncbi:MAG TPA: type II toxin-antitoxin system VapC family toxin [bacterium]|nr:type II toxin-antitoxin system VapC family toxin [bacterium]
MEKVIFDANAMLALLYGEKNGIKVEEILNAYWKAGAELLISAVNYGEMYYSIMRNFGKSRADELKTVLAGIPMSIVPVYAKDAAEAAEIKAGKKMSYADCFAAGLAKRLKAPLVTGDPEFREVEREIRVIWI